MIHDVVIHDRRDGPLRFSWNSGIHVERVLFVRVLSEFVQSRGLVVLARRPVAFGRGCDSASRHSYICTEVHVSNVPRVPVLTIDYTIHHTSICEAEANHRQLLVQP